jgi:hypothetical protein
MTAAAICNQINYNLTRNRADIAATFSDQILPILSSFNVNIYGNAGKVIGTVLHVSKCKKIPIKQAFGDKKVKVEKPYFRLVICR